MAGSNVELTVAANGNTAAVAANGSIAVQVTGAATAITLQMQRSTRDPAGGSPNWTNVGVAISGNPSTGIPLTVLEARGGGWWRGVVTGLTGSPALVSVSGDMAVASSLSSPADAVIGTLSLVDNLFPEGTNSNQIYARFGGKTTGAQLLGAPERIKPGMTSLTIEQSWPGAKPSTKTQTFPISVAEFVSSTVNGLPEIITSGGEPVYARAL